MKSQRPSGTRTMRYIILVLLIQLVLGIYAGSAIAGVTLKSRSPGSGESVISGDYVTLGTWAVSPLLWETLELKTSDDKTQQLWLASRHVDSSKFHDTSNIWSDSAIKVWLNGDFKRDSGLDAYSSGLLQTYSLFFKGYYLGDPYVSADAEIFLLSVEEVNYIYTGNVNAAANDPQLNSKRQAYSLGRHTWTRSPSVAGIAWYVHDDGYLFIDYVHNLLGVRPAFSLNLESLIFKSASNVSNSAAEGGEISNPYVLYVAAADVPVASVDISVSGKELTISFDQPVAHAYTDTASADALAAKFTVSDGQGEDVTVSGLEFKNGKLVLTLDKTFVDNEDVSNVSVTYKGLDRANDTDGIGFPATRTVMKSLISNKTQPGSISVTVDGKTYTAQQQPDDSYLILLSADINASVLSSLELMVTLPDGAKISPDIEESIDFSNDPVKFTITAADGKTTQDIIIEVRISVAQTAEGEAVTTDASQCHVYVTYNADGTLSVEIRLPFADGFDPLTLDSLSAALSHLTNLSFTYEDGEGGAYLRIIGTAEDLAALESAELSRLIYWLKKIKTEYRQDFNPALKIAEMLITYTNTPSGSSSNSHCNSGVGAAFFALAGLFFVGKKKR